MPLRHRIILALAIGMISASICWLRLASRGKLAADFTWPWRAAQLLLHGENPYTAIQPGGEYPFQTYFYYPLPAALAALPFAGLPPYPAGALFFGLSSGLLAFAISKEGWHGLHIFLGAPYWVALAVAQWSPLMVAAALLPGMEALLVCKPNIGLPGLIYRPSWRGVAGILAMLGLSLLVLPGWPKDWLQVVGSLAGHPPAALILPFGPLLLLAALRWKTPKGRLLLSLAIVPQLPFFYDQLLLWLIPASLAQGLALSGLSWAAYFAWRLTGLDPHSGAILTQPTQLILALVFLPALAMLLWPKGGSKGGAGRS
jgi:hypothetical protein